VAESLARFLAALLLGYLAFVLLVFLFQERLIYFPSRRIEATPKQVGLAFEEVRFPTDDGEILHGWHVPAPGPLTILFFHGNGGNISHRLDSIRIFHELGCTVFIFDYRGYGRSTGRPSEQGTYQDGLAAWRHLTTERGVAPGRIVLFGRSLGGAVAGWLAARSHPAGLILESTPVSVAELGAVHYPWLPVRWLVRHRYETLASLPQVHCPVLIVHSPDDEIVPFSHGERLFAAAPRPKAFLRLEGDHNQGFLLTGAAYQEGLGRFLAGLDQSQGAGSSERPAIP